MKELEVTLQLRNNRLKERRVACGLTIWRFADAVGVSRSDYSALEGLRTSPVGRDGVWRPIALQLANFHCVEPEELFPDIVHNVTQATASRKFDGDEVVPLLSQYSAAQRALPDEALIARESDTRLRRVVATLSPNEAAVLRARFGFDDGEEHSLRAVGQQMGRTQERVRQIEDRALRNLRHPRRRLLLTTGSLPKIADLVLVERETPLHTFILHWQRVKHVGTLCRDNLRGTPVAPGREASICQRCQKVYDVLREAEERGA
jgi:RNA polymerase sigma factor (sigma-70 family)